MLNHFAVLQVVVPLLAAPACLILERARAACAAADPVAARRAVAALDG